MGKRLVGVSHAMRVLALAHGGAAVFRSFQQLGGKAVQRYFTVTGECAQAARLKLM